MIRKVRILIFFSVTCTLLISCGGSPTGTSVNNKFEGVPSGEIVPVEKRDSVLTGASGSDSSPKVAAASTQKWWLQKVSKIDYTGCTGQEDEEITEENTYFGFKSSGDLYVKQGQSGAEQYATSWEWTDESKSAIIIEEYPDVEFELTALNDEELVYASLQQGEGGCSAVTWEQFGSPTVENTDGNNEAPNARIDNAQALNDALEFEGGEKVEGTIPSPASSTHSMGAQAQYVVTQNSSGELRFEVGLSDENRPAAAIFLQLDGATEYFVIPIEDSEIGIQGGASKITTTATGYNCAMNAPPCQGLSFPAKPLQNYEFPEEGLNVTAKAQAYIPPTSSEPCCSQLFGDNWEGRDNPDNWTEPVGVNFKAMNVGEGAVQVTLTWDAEVDLDLHVKEPNGFEIYYADPQSSVTGGFLDVDNTEGYGPENIFYEQTPPAGTYQVEVVYYSGWQPANYNVSVNQGGSVSTFSGTLSGSSEIDVITTFQGGN